MEIKNITKELSNAPVESKANINFIKLTGNENLSVYAAKIVPLSELNPHYHLHGIEPYRFLKGNGLMKVGKKINNPIELVKSFHVRQGDFFSIAEGTIHQIINDTQNPLLAIFSCPESHLGHERFFINN